MEIRFIPNSYREELTCDGIDAVPQEYLDSLMEDFVEYDNSIKIDEVNYGPGADWMWVYVAITGIANLIILGSQINSGFEGWLQLGKKLKNLIGKSSNIALDKQALSALAVSQILEIKHDVKEIKKVIEYDIEMPIFAGIQTNEEVSEFLSKAEFYYIQGYEIDSKGFILFGSNSSGELEILKNVNL